MEEVKKELEALRHEIKHVNIHAEVRKVDDDKTKRKFWRMVEIIFDIVEAILLYGTVSLVSFLVGVKLCLILYQYGYLEKIIEAPISLSE